MEVHSCVTNTGDRQRMRYIKTPETEKKNLLLQYTGKSRFAILMPPRERISSSSSSGKFLRVFFLRVYFFGSEGNGKRRWRDDDIEKKKAGKIKRNESRNGYKYIAGWRGINLEAGRWDVDIYGECYYYYYPTPAEVKMRTHLCGRLRMYASCIH